MSQLDCAAWGAKKPADSLAFHSIAIATELLLKSHLLRTASTDAWNRVQIGHNLNKAARYAERAGLDLPSRLSLVVDQLHPYFQRGGFQRGGPRAWPPGFADDAGDIVRELAKTVFDHARQGAHGS
ncbi:hypothetical protein [Rhizorhabdus histidinilytica]|uniref:hypothetical protein n=1 Tax=Rhizorhabdus histidinilytica TaxID=439228 RepID=UPI003220565E